MGTEKLGERLSRQSSHWAGLHHQGEGLLVIERVIPLDTPVDSILQFSGLAVLGRRGAIDLRIERNTVRSPAVPRSLSGFRILQLSDLHLDLQTGMMPRLLEAISSVDYYLDVITEDFEDSLRETAGVIKALKGPVFGILGNHDFVEMVPRLEDLGLPILLNETTSLAHQGAGLVLVGIDNPLEGVFQKHQGTKALYRNSIGPIPDPGRCRDTRSPTAHGGSKPEEWLPESGPSRNKVMPPCSFR